MIYIFTCKKDYDKLAVYELTRFDKTFDFTSWLDDGVGLGISMLDPQVLRKLVYQSPIMFIQHIFNVTAIVKFDDIEDRITCLCKEKLAKNSAFSIQTRFANGSPKDTGLTENLSKVLVQDGYSLDIAESKQIVSLYGTEECIYVGINRVEDNLSHWRGGMPHYSASHNHQFVSRAEFKLKEAVDVFGLDITKMKKGADLGAAPGGWTKVLADNDIEVVSIDPSNLKKEIAKRSDVKYYHMTVEKYLELPLNDKFDIIVNDMKMDVLKSINIINTFHSRINKDGLVVMTFKLSHEFSYNNICQYLRMFNGFELIGCRQLFHNRSEVTVVLKKNSRFKKIEKIKSRDKIDKPKKQNENKMSKKLVRKYIKKGNNSKRFIR